MGCLKGSYTVPTAFLPDSTTIRRRLEFPESKMTYIRRTMRIRLRMRHISVDFVLCSRRLLALGVPYSGVLIIRILLFRVLY